MNYLKIAILFTDVCVCTCICIYIHKHKYIRVFNGNFNKFILIDIFFMLLLTLFYFIVNLKHANLVKIIQFIFIFLR